MITYRYYTCGSMKEKEGLTLTMIAEGDFFSTDVKLYKRREISKEEYDNYLQMLADPNVEKGLAGGLVDEDGLRLKREFLAEVYDAKVQQNESKIALTVKKIKKQLDLGIITNEDIDIEIELNNMTEFKDVIKERLNN